MTSLRLYTPLFMVTLLLSAFLLFSVEPMAGKMILPLLGGTPQVWNTAMVFFQGMLLAGYAYAHFSARFLNIRLQAILHTVMLTGCIFILPIAIPTDWPAPDTTHPIGWQLHLMLVMAGIPFFLLAATAPLVQHWFARSGHPGAENPYFLYAASNAGSLVALLSYPLLIEPGLTLSEQSRFWSLGFMAMAGLMLASALLAASQNNMKAAPKLAIDPLRFGKRLQWLVLAFVPSSLMLGVTSYITTDIAALPLLWVMPLALYILTFIIAFSGKAAISARVANTMLPVMLLFVIFLSMMSTFLGAFFILVLHLTLFFFAALLCHCQLSNLKPQPGRLTEFYLIISLGGVLGGIFNTLIAPFIFVMPVEYALMLAMACFARFMDQPSQVFTKDYISKSLTKWMLPLYVVTLAAMAAMRFAGFDTYPVIGSVVAVLIMLAMMHNRLAFALGAVIILAFNPGFQWMMMKNLILVERSFFGVTRINNSHADQMRLFIEGTTVHGAQPLIDPYRLVPMSYYHPQGPLGDVFGALDRRSSPQKVAILGLGAGSVACYTKPGRLFDFYEINPIVTKIAQNTDYFTYLSQCGSPYKIVLGDGRLSLRNAPDHSYDMIMMDAFTSDNIPVHLVTSEAFKLYRQKLKPHGYIATNISNRYMNLIPVMQAAADAQGMDVYFKNSPGTEVMQPDIRSYLSLYALFMEKGEDPAIFSKAHWGTYEGPRARTWTDDYANPIAAMWFMQKGSLGQVHLTYHEKKLQTETKLPRN